VTPYAYEPELAASAASFAAAGFEPVGALFSGVTAGGGASAFALAALSSRFAFALGDSLAFDEDEPLSTADFWPCDLAAAADLPLSLAAWAAEASVGLGSAADFCGLAELGWGELSTAAVVGADAGGEVAGPDPGVTAGDGG
jgi:hypothetical protein